VNNVIDPVLGGEFLRAVAEWVVRVEGQKSKVEGQMLQVEGMQGVAHG